MRAFLCLDSLRDMTEITKHFKFEDFTFSETAIRKGIDNTPSDAVAERLGIVAHRMEFIRETLDLPVIITSGYRSPEVNKLVGGSARSAHCEGWAVDFRCPAFGTPYQVAMRVSAMGLPFDQLIHEYGSWVHISFDPAMRLQRWTIFDKKIGYVPAIMTRERYYAKEAIA